MSDPDLPVTVTYSQPRWRPEWAVPEVPVPESTWHDLGIEYLRALLLAWAERCDRNVLVARNLGIRWVKAEPRAGFDPDLCVIEPPPANPSLSSLRLWEEDHIAPWLAIELVSPSHPYKDYLDTPARCAACGVQELWVFDPQMAGPKSSGGPFALQVWERHGETMTRTHASNAPGYSPGLSAWLHPALSLPQPRLQIATAEVGGDLWPTLAEQQRSAADQRAHAADQRADAANQRANAAERALAELQKKLDALGRKPC